MTLFEGRKAPPGAAQRHPQATTVLLLGVVSLLLCPIIGPLVWFQGRRMLADIERHPEPISGRRSIEFGIALGAVASVLLVALPVLLGVLFLFDR